MLLQSLIGGLIIGVGVSVLLLGRGQLAGISGIFGNTITGNFGEGRWRLAFLAGFLLSPVLFYLFTHQWIASNIQLSLPGIIVAGFLVGVGTQLGTGCTSGHGVCGLGNLSTRSLVATVTFMFVAGVTVYIARHVVGG
ncbi:YeeE/YedE family protein [Stenotrophobium rhamnosiphilum]|uniref:YeeE/YedE family protein n=1 Tax=Stenotrophobium rhamnosiphilum TaxID=2029166 RepID=A0A2T5MDT0_9GAMM|nr:hypothetical protein [Stenotrophobium rhamnosiphilum]PTU30741.1 hypothetical protein CJD38_14740 [Stenotrophobium rhamnosiphilum]